MDLKTFRRVLQLERDIYTFNKMTTAKIESDDSPCLVYYKYTDIWLHLAALPVNLLHTVISATMITLLKQDRSLLLSGKKIAGLVKYFSAARFQQVLKFSPSLMKLPNIDCWRLLMHPDFWDVSCKHLLDLIYRNKSKILYQRVYFKLSITDDIPVEISQFWQAFPLSLLEDSILEVFKYFLPKKYELIKSKFTNEK